MGVLTAAALPSTAITAKASPSASLSGPAVVGEQVRCAAERESSVVDKVVVRDRGIVADHAYFISGYFEMLEALTFTRSTSVSLALLPAASPWMNE